MVQTTQLDYRERINSPAVYQVIISGVLSLAVSLAAWPLAAALFSLGYVMIAVIFLGLTAFFYFIVNFTYCTRLRLRMMSTFKGNQYVFQARGVQKGMRPDIPCRDIKKIFPLDFDTSAQVPEGEELPVSISQPGFRGRGMVIVFEFETLLTKESRSRAIHVPTANPVKRAELARCSDFCRCFQWR
ncbi:MAG: hypothetical protein HOC23_11540 [Halieaceae bacterium]|mgnify:CR=1 FL=1|jgi:hypothetical protein|nr:hypothetical protein [Halieaceae bacterium]